MWPLPMKGHRDSQETAEGEGLVRVASVSRQEIKISQTAGFLTNLGFSHCMTDFMGLSVMEITILR